MKRISPDFSEENGTGSASVKTREKMAMTAVENLLAGLRGKLPQNFSN
ncbi:MAG: hypothetical protein HY879_08725 [Deltaproteobacteria bacterium]|nr:hypothetical protein [Deltaproteobacteria bacterium]